MVGRSKPSKNMLQKPSVEFNTAENLYLKAKNVELAKALADSKNAYKQMVEERDFLQRELFTANLRNKKLENLMKKVDSSAQYCISTIVASSNHVTEILGITNSIQRLTNIANESHTFCQDETPRSKFDSANSSSGLTNKTQAVKPMIGGHVIFRPTINLRRVNEIPLEEIRRLQSNSNRENSNDDSHSSSAESQNEDSPPTGSSFPFRSNNGRTFRNYQQPMQTVSGSSGDNHEVEEEFTDQSSELSDMASRISNGLGTVPEEREDELGSSLSQENLNSLTNASTSSIGLPGNTSQVPLLSGVFRDVRVYLSPMQNVGQYMDPRQNVTKERGSSKSHKLKRSQSIHSTRSTGNIHSTENRKLSVDNLNLSSSSQNNLNLSGSLQNQSNGSIANSSAEASCSSLYQNSILTSTKIGTPKSGLTKSDGSSYMSNSSWRNVSNKFENSPQNQSMLSNSNGTMLNISNGKWTPVRGKRSSNFISKTPELPRRSYQISNRNSVASTTDYDPREGPSTMADVSDNETKSKIETLSRLGLRPTFGENLTSTPLSPSSPAAAVLQRRERQLNKSNNDTPNRFKKSIHVTKRRSIEKKKAALVSSKVAKVVVRRMSLSRLSGSPRKSSGSPQKETAGSLPKRKNFSKPLKKSPNQSQENTKSANATPQSCSSKENSPPNSISTKKIRPKREKKSKAVTPQSDADSKSKTPTSPKKGGRTRRIPQQVSLKEPSLRKKMRRSK